MAVCCPYCSTCFHPSEVLPDAPALNTSKAKTRESAELMPDPWQLPHGDYEED